jgi:biopolymer transport protein ExbB
MPSSFIAWGEHVLDAGGPVMPWIIAASTWMWALIIERIIFLWRILPVRQRRLDYAMATRIPRNCRVARRWCAALAAELVVEAGRDIALVRALVQALPLLGLLGTVIGLVDAFGAVTLHGGHRQAIGGGISDALVATLAGLITALSGLGACALLESKVERLRLSLKFDEAQA